MHLIIILYHISGSIDNKHGLNYNVLMKMSTRKLILIFAAAVIVCIAVYIAAVKLAPEGATAVIYIDGAEYRRIDLSKTGKAYEFTVETEYGSNTVLVEPGAISVSSADCPDKICVHQGKLTRPGVPIICMPHRLVIRIEGDEVDAWS